MVSEISSSSNCLWFYNSDMQHVAIQYSWWPYTAQRELGVGDDLSPQTLLVLRVLCRMVGEMQFVPLALSAFLAKGSTWKSWDSIIPAWPYPNIMASAWLFLWCCLLRVMIWLGVSTAWPIQEDNTLLTFFKNHLKNPKYHFPLQEKQCWPWAKL